jgi:hypothetical protein
VPSWLVNARRQCWPTPHAAGSDVRRWLLARPPGVDDDIVADAAGDVVVQAEADDAVIVGVEGLERVFAQDQAEGINQRFP